MHTKDKAILEGVRKARRPLSIEELREATERPDLDSMDCLLMIEDGLLRTADMDRCRYFIEGEASDPDYEPHIFNNTCYCGFETDEDEEMERHINAHQSVAA